MTDDQILEVVQAHKEGKQIEVKPNHGYWGGCVLNEPNWNFADYDYRVKTEPRKPRDFWIHFHSYGFMHEVHENDVRHCPSCVHVREVIE